MKIKSVLAFEGGTLIITVAIVLACSGREGNTEGYRAGATGAFNGGAVNLSATAIANNAFMETANVPGVEESDASSASRTAKLLRAWGEKACSLALTMTTGNAVKEHNRVTPMSWTSNNTAGVYLAKEKNAMAAMLASFTPAQLTNAKIATTFTDVLLTAKNSYLPCGRQGINAGLLSAASQAKVLAAIKPWLQNLDTTTAALLLRTYTNELSGTFVTYANNQNAASGNAGSFFTTQTDYVRIDGPSVWIELVCQPGAAANGPLRYHAVFKDHARDYAAR